MPKVYIIPDKNLNAFATGRNEKHAAVAATEGILEVLQDNELRGVMAHEFAHIKNRDILISTVAGTIAGIISYVSHMMMYSAMFGNRDNRGNVFSLILLAIITHICHNFVPVMGGLATSNARFVSIFSRHFSILSGQFCAVARAEGASYSSIFNPALFAAATI